MQTSMFVLFLLFSLLSTSRAFTGTTHAAPQTTRQNLPECAPCTASILCSSRICLQGQCVFNTPSSFARCFSLPRRPECAACDSAGQCLQGICWGYKCTDGTPTSLRKCFLPPCSPCSSSLQCSTKFCFAGRCRPSATSHINMECEKKPRCAHCTDSTQCASGKCRDGQCVSIASHGHLPCSHVAPKQLAGPCEACQRDRDCREGRCHNGKCMVRSGTSDNFSECRDPTATPSPTDGDGLPEWVCRICKRDRECGVGGTCVGGKCVTAVTDMKTQCFRNECAQCGRSLQCAQGECWKGQCVPLKGDMEREKRRRRCLQGEGKKLCETCESAAECGERACWWGRCVERNMESLEACFGETVNGSGGMDGLNFRQ